MGREKKKRPQLSTVASAKERHRKKTRRETGRSAPSPSQLEARKAIPKSRHQTYLEFVQNEDYKKKPLDFQHTTQREPPPLFFFVPIGNPELTMACKDLSRERGAMVYIVSNASGPSSDLSQQMNRVGYHFRHQIVQEAMRSLNMTSIHDPELVAPGGVERIPQSQKDINEQADAAIRELFPRIPNTDRGEIISHAFRKGKTFNGEPVVGLQQNLSLSRRVQLAVLAHIRHNHTRYDELLRETTWANARKATEQLCLDYLVKWRGDDESGRDQLDEILREVVVLSDDESEDGDSFTETESALSDDVVIQEVRPVAPVAASNGAVGAPQDDYAQLAASSRLQNKARKKQANAAKPGKSKNAMAREKRNFRRYQAAWDQAVDRHRAADEQAHEQEQMATYRSTPARGSDNYGSSSKPMGGYTVFASPRENNTRPSQPGMALPLQPAPCHGFVEARPHPNGASAILRPPSPRYVPSDDNRVSGKVNNGAGRLPLPHDSARSVHPFASSGPNGQLQDMLHPSIEPMSPGGPRYRLGQQSRPAAVHDAWRGAFQPAELLSRDRDGVVDRGHGRPMSIDRGPAYVDVTQDSRTYDAACHGYDGHNSPPVRMARHHPPPVHNMSTMPREVGSQPWPSGEESVHRRGQGVPYSGPVSTRSNHMFEERGVSSQSAIRVPYDDSNFIDRRYVGHERSRYAPGRAQAPLPASSMSKGFVTLREAAPAPAEQDLTSLSTEGFIRIREAPPVWHNPVPYHASHMDMPPPDRAGLSHAARRVRSPDQRIFVQRHRPGSVPIEQSRRETIAYRNQDPTRPPPRTVYEESSRGYRVHHHDYPVLPNTHVSRQAVSGGPYARSYDLRNARTPARIPPDHEIVVLDS
ncbi:hypothetical protein SODALDRAFT_329960 [Sodiomyces alkalinus F11]|uniref:DUF2293 domain-containing protein n=1 Tax=Sodiomyces alkalinus (strain CBS 110278 / VKM F-3762 / F11) TaxID=1314773 RepID=A0A3N2Q0X4_SODAK|nr:hypothetical protein SODALDRAFT_329960 [Sodiomyces alkalinus F11]ROT40265.1 hypothetical protein SODALDRAFT_329960 [Sodiomyces alkalinus F11]